MNHTQPHVLVDPEDERWRHPVFLYRELGPTLKDNFGSAGLLQASSPAWGSILNGYRVLSNQMLILMNFFVMNQFCGEIFFWLKNDIEIKENVIVIKLKNINYDIT